MRVPRYMSPSSLKIWDTKRDDYYLYYLADVKMGRPPQTEPMAVGSAFDAYVKSYLVEKLLGKRPEFEFTTIFEAQVEPQVRDFALDAGRICFEAYQRQGALADVLADMTGCIGVPRFEASLEGFVTSVSISKQGIPLLGKPDIFFIHKGGARVIFDWKVNGYCGNNPTSPKPGYIRERTANPMTTGKSHKLAQTMMYQGIKIAASHPLDTVEKDWAAQLSIYAWLLGEDIGSDFIVAIDQLACAPDPTGKTIRVAQHRSLVTPEFQKKVFQRAANAWAAIQSGHIFDDLPREKSDERCIMLDAMASMPSDPIFDDIVR